MGPANGNQAKRLQTIGVVLIFLVLLIIVLLPVLITGINASSIIAVGIMAIILIHNFKKAQQKSKETVVKYNIEILQSAVEAYARDFDGAYPGSIDSTLRTYFPGGEPRKCEGVPPVNPFNQQAEWPVVGKISNLHEASYSLPQNLDSGVIQYCCIYNENGAPVAYAITGGDANGKMLVGFDKTRPLILTNQSLFKEHSS